tara:strand:+ start:143 stop:439 length:297 start_codon:yes stop_codon:yes gene_type:complete
MLGAKECETSYSRGKDGEQTIFVFRPDESTKATIVDPFILGQYSQINRHYVSDNFPKYMKNTLGTRLSRNYQILNRDIKLVEMWEKRLGVIFTEDMEA